MGRGQVEGQELGQGGRAGQQAASGGIECAFGCGYRGQGEDASRPRWQPKGGRRTKQARIAREGSAVRLALEHRATGRPEEGRGGRGEKGEGGLELAALRGAAPPPPTQRGGLRNFQEGSSSVGAWSRRVVQMSSSLLCSSSLRSRIEGEDGDREYPSSTRHRAAHLPRP